MERVTLTLILRSAKHLQPTQCSWCKRQSCCLSSRVASVAGIRGRHYGVSAIAYNSTIYNAVEADASTTRSISNLSAIQMRWTASTTRSSFTKTAPVFLLVRQLAGTTIVKTLTTSGCSTGSTTHQNGQTASPSVTLQPACWRCMCRFQLATI